MTTNAKDLEINNRCRRRRGGSTRRRRSGNGRGRGEPSTLHHSGRNDEILQSPEFQYSKNVGSSLN